jgi:hypothetical protein
MVGVLCTFDRYKITHYVPGFLVFKTIPPLVSREEATPCNMRYSGRGSIGGMQTMARVEQNLSAS